ncbi:MAG TPA: aspartate kinase [Myxococcaceae bacterium]|nr:aspartate kinase [Myxococcaceae bacterium]
MSVIVQKFGGSSVADVERIRKVAARVAARRAEGHQLVVVVSAMGDTTDELLSLARKMSADPPRRELDMLLTCGERISMALLSMALHEQGVPAISFTGSQSGIITDDTHAQARIVEVRPVRIREELGRGKVVIVAGYQGVSRNREVTTLGRGGSDTTAVALAAALGAEACEIYSDVDGVFSADPRVVPEARKLETLDYGTMQELAAAGARVLNAQAVEFARNAGIVIDARSTHGAGTGSRIGPDPAPVRAVASDTEVRVLVVPEVQLEPVLRSLADHEIRLRLVAGMGAGPGQLLLVVPLQDVHGVEAFDARLRALGADPRPGLGTVTLAGPGVGTDSALLARCLAAAAALGVEVAALHGSALQLTFVVAGAHVPGLARELHRLTR